MTRADAFVRVHDIATRETSVCTVDEMVAANSEDEEILEWLEVALNGESLIIGGGASPQVQLTLLDEAHAIVRALAEESGEALVLREEGADAPLPWAVWCRWREADDMPNQDIIGAGMSARAAIDEARETLRAWREAK